MNAKDRGEQFKCQEHEQKCVFLENTDLFNWMKIDGTNNYVMPHTPQGKNLMRVNYCQYCGKNVNGIELINPQVTELT
ncbi:MAG: hypothetical protein ACWA44_02780 [Thiotrichales bacterium]